MSNLDAPFPWFGGKSRVADVVWNALGDVEQYVEPFFGSGAVLLGRPTEPRVETVNDKDHWIANFWRAVRHEPEAVAFHADNPVNEDDLSARHIWLVKHAMPELAARMPADPDYYDAKVAGWWVWGICCWIGSGWCSGKGPWTEEDGKLVHLGDAGRGVNRQCVHLGDAGRGVNRKRPHFGGEHGGMPGVLRPNQGLLEWMQALAARLRYVRVCCGDWKRVVTTGALSHGNPAGIFLDPPYSQDVRATDLYGQEAGIIPAEAHQWCIENGENPRYRIALCGYDGEHNELEAHGWRVHNWKANVSYQTAKGSANKDNRKLERIWFSPNCLANQQGSLL